MKAYHKIHAEARSFWLCFSSDFQRSHSYQHSATVSVHNVKTMRTKIDMYLNGDTESCEEVGDYPDGKWAFRNLHSIGDSLSDST